MRETPLFGGVELLAWNSLSHPNLDDRIVDLYNAGFDVGGVHGRIGETLKNPFEIIRTGLLDPVKATVLNAMMLDTQTLIRKYGQLFDYVLVHTAEIDGWRNFKAATDPNKKILTLCIENDCTNDSRGLYKAVYEVRRLREMGVNARLMFDPCHVVPPLGSGNPLRVWREAIRYSEEVRILPNDLVFGVHLALGLRLADSLPFDDVKGEIELWRDFADVLNSDGGVKTVVIENQQAGLGDQLRPSTESLGRQARRNHIIYDHLAKFAIV